MSEEQPSLPGRFYDDMFADEERLPRQFNVRVEELNTEPSRALCANVTETVPPFQKEVRGALEKRHDDGDVEEKGAAGRGLAT